MGRRGTRGTRTAERRRRRKRQRTFLTAALAALVVGLGGAVAFLARDDTPAEARAPRPARTTGPPAPAPSESSATSSPTASPSASPSSSPPRDIAVPDRGPGTFTPAHTAGERQGQGRVRRYKVEVENGIDLDPDEAARSVSAILGGSQGWTNDPAYGFQLVSSGPADFTVRIATPGTTDRLCFVTTPSSKGNVNCRVQHSVVVNLKLWVRGSPQFDGPIEDYRALIINHEVGHEIGRGHETCPGPGQPAPAMMQQIKGLLGCTANAWPYDSHGRYLAGPFVP
ncbi:DUF3152 domain-containing protein [Streptomyces sp. NPDC102451]|uniref:DUF3152 domain-containing protein n=1 Tax=Streptomyces sp. NPDC102451 TaxID=3366177 RepID=UPI00382B6992